MIRSWSVSAGFLLVYNNLVSDMRSLAIMRETGCPVVFVCDALCTATGRER